MKLKIDFHVHTCASSDGVDTLGAVLKSAQKVGLDAVAISDHDICSVAETHGVVKIIPACEVTTTQGHMLGLFIEKPLTLNQKKPNICQAAQLIHECGGIAVMAHPFDTVGGSPPLGLEDIVDGVEVVNARVHLRNPEGNAQALDFAKQHGLMCTAGSDSHLARELGGAYTVLECKSTALEDIKAALLEGKGQTVLVRKTTNVRKAISQMHMRWHTKNIRKIFVGVIYFLRAIWRDLF